MESGLHDIDHYLDDFLFAGADKTSNCSKLMNTFTEVCSQLGIPIADDKREGPSTRITYLDLLIDTYLLRLKNIIALAPFHQEFELTSFQCQLKGPNKLSLLMDLPFYHQLLGYLIVNKLR
jgi:hypothetical protein